MPARALPIGEPADLVCADDTRLGAHLWRPVEPGRGTVVINPATGVVARYYHWYARYLAANGFTVLTYDYRGIGLSRPASLRGSRITWLEWGTQDCEAAIAFAACRHAGGPLTLVGHSIGGFLVGFAPSAARLDRILTVGAQYAYWPDYAARRRLALLLRWHLAMPLLTALCGYFPGRRLGWLEDLPAGVVRVWSRQGARFETGLPVGDRASLLDRLAAVRAPILAVAMTDDEFATAPAMDRALAYYSGCERHRVILAPAALGQLAVGHFALFHDRYRETFWPATLEWLRDGRDPWIAEARTLPPQESV